MRKILSIILSTAMVIALFANTNIAQAGKGGKSGGKAYGENAVLFAEQISINGTKLTAPSDAVAGTVAKNNLLELLSAEMERKDRLSLSGSQLSVDTASYVTGTVSLAGSKITINKPVVAAGDITVSATDVTIAEGAALISLNGSVNLYCTNLTVNGPIYAANKVLVTGSKTTVNEGVFAKNIEIYTGSYGTDGTVGESVRKGQRNKTATLSLYGMDDKNMLFAYANFDFTTMDVYGRKNGENSFSLLQPNITEEELEIPSSWSIYTDFAAVLTNEFGFSFKTEPLSVAIEENTWFSSYGVDTDEDSVPDAYELWLAGTNPNTPDTFPNAEFYVYLAGEEETTCYDRLLRRDVSVTTEDFTKTFLYEETDYPGRATGATVRYTDGTIKQIHYEYENDRLKTLHVGENIYTIEENENGLRYFINNTCIKQVSQSEQESIVSHYDTADEISRFDSEANLISYQNGSLYEMTYDNLDLMTGLAKNGVPYAAYTYDDYGVFLTIDATDYSIHYTYDYPCYQADYTYGGQNPVHKTQKVNCKDEAYVYGDIVLLTDGTNGAKIPTTFRGEILSSKPDTRILQYRIGEETYTVKFNPRGYVAKDTVAKAGTTDTTVNEYSYDAYGNLQTVKTTKNGQTTVQRYSYNSSWSDELTSFDGRAIMYDTLGKPTEYYNGMSFTWAAGKLATVQNGENSASYRYDYQGLREEKTVNGVTTKYLYEGRDLITECSEDPLYFTYDGSFNLVGFEWNGTAYYYQYDIFGDVVGIVNVAGETLCTYSYDLWGAITGITGDQALAERNPIRYRGYYYDNETGFYYLETRYYDPQTKRFLSYDDLESFFYGAEEDMESLFVYCQNNPVMFSDSDGRVARFYDIMAIALSEWKEEAEEFVHDMGLSFISELRTGGYGASYIQYTNGEQFINSWNNLDDSFYEVVVIDTHGSYSSIGKGDGIYANSFHYSEFSKLKYKTGIKLVVLLGCNCGHYDHASSNMAWGFLKKTYGCVVASDGTVDSLAFGRFASVNDKYFKNQRVKNSTRGNKGWMIYAWQSGSYKYLFTGWSSYLSCLTAKKMVKFLKNNGLLN